jgi:hypothetical protein
LQDHWRCLAKYAKLLPLGEFKRSAKGFPMNAPTKNSHLEQSDSEVGPTLTTAGGPAIVLASDEFLMPDEVT